MNADRLRERVKQRLQDAQAARESGDAVARDAALSGAVADARELQDVPLLQSACWRLAKARFDARDDHRLLDALRPLLDHRWEERDVWRVRRRVGPFDHYRAGLRALPSLMARHTDAVGYADPAIEALWEAWIEAREQEEDAFLLAWGRTHLAWVHAVTGRVDAVDAVAQRYARLTPRTFGTGAHAHPRAAAHPEHTVFHVQLDLLRTLLRAATWSGLERKAWEARELLLDAAVEADHDVLDDPWVLDALARAAERFGHPVEEPWVRAMGRLSERAAVPAAHRARLKAWLARREGDGAEAAEAAAEACAAESAGPEWVVESWLEAHEAGASGALEQALSEAERTGVVMDRLG